MWSDLATYKRTTNVLWHSWLLDHLSDYPTTDALITETSRRYGIGRATVQKFYDEAYIEFPEVRAVFKSITTGGALEESLPFTPSTSTESVDGTMFTHDEGKIDGTIADYCATSNFPQRIWMLQHHEEYVTRKELAEAAAARFNVKASGLTTWWSKNACHYWPELTRGRSWSGHMKAKTIVAAESTDVWARIESLRQALTNVLAEAQERVRVAEAARATAEARLVVVEDELQAVRDETALAREWLARQRSALEVFYQLDGQNHVVAVGPRDAVIAPVSNPDI